jgi:hypothetical protein
MKIFCVKKGCKLKISIRRVEDVNKYRNTKINYRQKKSTIDIQHVSRLHRKLKEPDARDYFV